jgi:E3 ubiquitin-protein ligase BRE1
MPAIEASTTVPVAQSGLVIKMEDRKRPASYDSGDPTPPLKKQATTSVNGGGRASADSDMPWKDDLDVSIPLICFAPRVLCVLRAFYSQSSALAY